MVIALLRLEEENGAMTQVEVDEVLRFFDFISATSLPIESRWTDRV